MKAWARLEDFTKTHKYHEDFGENLSIQNFKADFPLKVSLNMLSSAGNTIFSDLVSVYLKVFDH